MSAGKHTPGPWVVEPILDRFNVYIAGAACVCIARDCTADDAGLIAAAPDLLDIVRAVKIGLDSGAIKAADIEMLYPSGAQRVPLSPLVDKAYAKATGASA